MKRAFFAMCVFSLLNSACTQRTICPAFQSAYIYDQEALRKKFSYFEEDSTPKILTASKNKYLVAEEFSYRKRLSRLATVEMKDVQPVVPDSLLMEDYVSKEDLDSAARSIIDSTYIVDTEVPEEDSVDADDAGEYVITKDKEVRVLRYNKDSISYKVDEVRYNNDQDTYMWYLRDVLVLPDIRLLQLKSQEKAAEEKRAGKKGGFFRNLFKKKKKKETAPVDTTEMEAPVERSEYDLDYVEDEETQPQVQEVEEEKKGLFGKKKKKKKDEGKVSTGTSAPEKPKKEKKKKKEEDPIPDDDKPADDEVKGEEGF